MSGFLNQQDQSQSRNMFLSMVLAIGVILVWQAFMTPIPPPPIPPAGAGSGNGDLAGDEPLSPELSEPAVVAEGSVSEKNPSWSAEPLPPIRMDGPNHSLSVSNVGGRIVGVSILSPEQYVPRESIIGVFPGPDEQWLPMAIAIGGLPDLMEDSVYEVVEEESEVVADGSYASVTFRWVSPDGSIEVWRRYLPDERSFGVRMEVEVRNTTTAARRFEGLQTRVYGEFTDQGGGMMNHSASVLEGVCAGDYGVERRPARKVDEERAFGVPDMLTTFGGIGEQYFMTVVMPEEGVTVDRCSYSPVDDNHVVTRLDVGPFTVAPGGSERIPFAVFTGPKHESYLSEYPGDLNQAVDFGMFSFLAIPIRYFLLLFQGWVTNWGLAIIILTVFIKLLLFPVTQKAYVGMEKMKRVQPQLKELQKKYESDRMKLSEAQMKLFREEGVSPMSGCLPMLAQMPIYFALYRTIWGSAELYNAPFALWVTDLSQPDPYFVLPILMGAVMVIQQRLTPQAVDNPQMKMVSRIMPIMFTAMMLFLPSGLVLYIFINMLLSIFQMLLIRKQHGSDAPTPPAKS